MYKNYYFVDRDSGTYSDTCVAFGLAFLLQRALQDAGKSSQVTLKDYGTAYLLQLVEPITADIVSCATYPDELLPFIQDEPHPEHARHYPLGEYFNLLRSKTSESAGQADTELAAQLEVPDDFGAFNIIQQLQASIGKGQNSGVWDRITDRLWAHREQKYYQNLVKIALTLYSETPNRLEEGLAGFRAWRKANDISSKAFEDKDKLVAVFNPAWQQSTNSAKPDGPREVGHLGFWLPEYLKMIGLPRCALVVSVQSGRTAGKRNFNEEDKKIYVLSPTTIELQTHTSIMKAFRPGIRNPSSIKADITVLLNYLQAFLGYVEHSGQRRRFGKPNNTVSGFYCAYFKKSGKQKSAYSLTNLPFLQLPAWVRFQDAPTEAEIALYQNIIEHEHEVLFYRYSNNGKLEDFIDENQSEGCDLLRQYRDFLSGGSLPALFDFYAGFAALIMQQAAQKKPYRQFKTSQIRRLLEAMTPTLQQTLDDEGFREVARAIRLCTVTAQRLKAKKVKTQHEIRYGLAQELKRKAPFKHEFTSAIMEFVNQYQTENARYRERGGSNIHEVTTTHVRHLAALIDACPGDNAEPIASLLLAFGYAFDDDPTEEDLAADKTTTPENAQTQGASQ